MKLAYSTLACPDWTIEQATEAARRYGYTGLEWRLADGQIIDAQTGPEILERIKQACRERDQAIVCLDSSCAFVQPDNESRQKTVQVARVMIDQAARLETPYLRVFGGKLPAGQDRTEVIKQTAETLGEAGEYATRQGVSVLLETHDDWSRSLDALELIQTAQSSSAALGLVWDVFHTSRLGETPAETLQRLQTTGQPSHVHIKDGRLQTAGSNEWELTLLEEGQIPVREILHELAQVGYQNYLSVEWEKKWHPEIAAPEIALPQFAELMRGYLANL